MKVRSLAFASLFAFASGALVPVHAGPYSSAQANSTVGAIDPGVGAFVTTGGSETGTASGNGINPRLVAWATGVVNYSPSPGVSASFQSPLNALGPVGTSTTIVSLGDISNPNSSSVPGTITLSFSSGIANGAGADFAVFENGFLSGGKLFAELAYVEVSSDGTDFARFPAISLTPAAVGAYGTLDSTGVHGLAGKNAAFWGTPFDLSALAGDPLVTSGRLDLNNISYVRLVDIPGNGFYTDSLGNPIYDAYLTTGSGGFDLDAIGVIHAVPEPTTLAMVALGAGLLVGRGWLRRSKRSAGITVIMLVALMVADKVHAITLDDIEIWAGAGTNRAAMVVHWSAPEVRNNTTVPAPAAEKSLVWGYRWNGTNNAEQMFNAIVAADQRLFVVAGPPSESGILVYALGYDLNNNGVFGVQNGTNVFAESSFTNGLHVSTDENPDDARTLDAGDLFWSGLYGANWELWREQGEVGGFTQAPERGANVYWTPDDVAAPYAGRQGQWVFAQFGLAGITLANGSWIGWTIAAGGLEFPNPDAPGTIAYNFHKHAPSAPQAASTNSAYAVQVIAAQGPFGSSPYNDSNCVLGAPATRFYESAAKPATRVKLVEPAYSYAPDRTNKLIITLNPGSAIIAKFSQPVYDNPANPYGIDFEVFGNTFFVGSGFSSDAANLNIYPLATGAFAEPTKISVSPGYTGQPGENANDPATWPWYRYDNGPYGDSVFPTQAYKWNRAGAGWTEELLDFTKPVNPVLKSRFSAGSLTAADGIDLYAGSGGGTGFDLKESGFTSIQYIKAEGLSGYSGGEIDAFAIVRPMAIGDTLSIAPANLTNHTAQLFFQRPGAENQNVLALNFTNISDIAQITTARLDDATLLALVVGTPVNALQLTLAAILNTNAVSFYADLGLSAGANYTGNGGDLHVAQWTGTNWLTQPFTFDAANNCVILAGVTNLSAVVVSQIVPPQLSLRPGTNGFSFEFVPVANCPQTLERSTDLVTWTPLVTFTTTNSGVMTLADSNAPASKAFYRLHLAIP